MRVRLLTLRYSATLGGFDEEPLRRALQNREVLAFREHFFEVHDVPHVTCVVTYDESSPIANESPNADRQAPQGSRGASTQELMASLDEPERRRFQTLREWRAAKAREEGVPPYILLTNRQLLEIVQRRPESPTALSHCPGIGKAKVERYGAEILGCLREEPDASPAKPEGEEAEA